MTFKWETGYLHSHKVCSHKILINYKEKSSKFIVVKYECLGNLGEGYMGNFILFLQLFCEVENI